MADILDVQTALRAAIYAALYPTGSPPSLFGLPIKIYPGWPDPDTLEIDLAPVNGAPSALHVSIYPRPGDRDTTRYPFDWQQPDTLPTATYTLTRAGQTITVGGAAPNPYSAQNLLITLNGVAFVTQATSGQTTASIAAALYALIGPYFAGSSVAGSVITVPATARIGNLMVGITAPVSKEVGREEMQFQITVWADSPLNRSALAKAIDPVLRDTPRMTLSDGSIARLKHVSSGDNDFDQKQGIYRRDMIFDVEFATTRTMTAAQIVVEVIDVDDPFGNQIYTSDPTLPVTSYSLDFSDPNNSFNLPGI